MDLHATLQRIQALPDNHPGSVRAAWLGPIISNWLLAFGNRNRSRA